MQQYIGMDKLNNRILHELSVDGRISNAELADRVGLSPSACLRRVQELERSEIIQGYRAQLNRAALGINFSALIAIGLSDHSTKSQKMFETAIQKAPEVIECHNITGAYEYMLRVEVSDLAAYKVFHSDVLGALPQVNTITTFVVMDSPKNER